MLSTFVLEPIRWNERFGWRRMTEKERVALFYFWRAVGQRMNIHDIPATLADFERFSIDYEREHYRHTESNHRVGAATRVWDCHCQSGSEREECGIRRDRAQDSRSPGHQGRRNHGER